MGENKVKNKHACQDKNIYLGNFFETHFSIRESAKLKQRLDLSEVFQFAHF